MFIPSRPDRSPLGACLRAALTVAVFFSPSFVAAQEEGDELQGVDEIIVTITKRAESLQDVAASVSAFDAQTIRETNVERMSDLVLMLPNVQIKGNDNDGISIRGISKAVTSQSPVVMHMNGIFLYEPDAMNENFYDLEGIQVQRGPVGTVYGRNATAGAVNVEWRKPHADWEVFGDATYASFDRYQVRGGVNLPFLGVGDDRLTGRFVFQNETRDPYVNNEIRTKSYAGRKVWSTRMTVQARPNEDVEINLRGFWNKDQRGGGATKPVWDPAAPIVGVFDGGFLQTNGDPIRLDPYGGLTLFRQDLLNSLEFSSLANLHIFNNPGVFATQADALSDLLINGFTGIPVGCDPNVPFGCFAPPVAAIVGGAEFYQPSTAGTGERDIRSVAWDRLNPELEVYGVDFDLTWQLSELPLLGDAALHLVAGWQRKKQDFLNDADGTSARIIDNYTPGRKNDNFTAEIQLQSTGEGPVDWIAGVFWFERKGEDPGTFTFTMFGLNRSNEKKREWGYAPFVSLTVRPLELLMDNPPELANIEVFGGIRRNRDFFELSTESDNQVIQGGGSLSAEDVFREITYEAGLRWRPNDDHTIYGKYSKGYKAGLAELDQTRLTNNVVEPEQIRAWEVGWKANWLDGTLRTALTSFYYDYTDLQIFQINGFQLLTKNAAEATNWGVEFEASWYPISDWKLAFAGGYLDATFGEFCSHDENDYRPTLANTAAVCLDELDPVIRQGGSVIGQNFQALDDLSGNRLEDAPKWSFSLLSTYHWDLGEYGSLTPVLEFTWTDEYYRRPFNRSDTDLIGDHTRTDLRLLWRSSDDRLSAEVFVENLEDNIIYGRTVAVAIPPAVGLIGLKPPRIFGVRVGFRWGGTDS